MKQSVYIKRLKQQKEIKKLSEMISEKVLSVEQTLERSMVNKMASLSLENEKIKWLPISIGEK